MKTLRTMNLNRSPGSTLPKDRAVIVVLEKSVTVLTPGRATIGSISYCVLSSALMLILIGGKMGMGRVTDTPTAAPMAEEVKAMVAMRRVENCIVILVGWLSWFLVEERVDWLLG